MSDQSIIHVIAGPTASGKSALALSKAQELNGVIINADSMQIYDALPILTAQPSTKEQTFAPHKLYGILQPEEKCSAGRWRTMAIKAIEETLSAKKTPIITGGSGLYIKALLEGFSPIPDVPDEVRARTNALHEELGANAFYAMMQTRDPQMAQRFHPHHTARLVRAYEVLEATGQSLATYQDMPREEPPAHWHFHVTLVTPEKSLLDKRCDARFEWMMDNGALEEVSAFYNRPVMNEAALIHRALGAAPLRAYLAGALSREDAIKRGKNDTRRYAKRQLTWFRHQVKPAPNITFLK